MTRFISKLGLFILCLLSIQSCKRENTYPANPVIEFNSFVADGMEAHISFNFTDGDGNFGLKESDTYPPFDPLSYYFNNCFITYEEKVNGQWGNPSVYKYRIPYLTPEGQNKSLNGKIDIFLHAPYYNFGSFESDTIRFKIKIYDRALNESNEIITDEIYPL